MPLCPSKLMMLKCTNDSEYFTVLCECNKVLNFNETKTFLVASLVSAMLMMM